MLSIKFALNLLLMMAILFVNAQRAVAGSWNKSKTQHYVFEKFYANPDSFFKADEHLANSALLRVPLPTTNRVIKDYDRYRDYRVNALNNAIIYTEWLWNERGYKGDLLDPEKCLSVVAGFEVTTRPDKSMRDFIRCKEAIQTHAVKDFDGGVDLFGRLFLMMAEDFDERWAYRPSNIKNYNPTTYYVAGTLAPFIMYYTVNYDAFDYSEPQRAVVNEFFVRKAFEQEYDKNSQGRNKTCPILDPMKLSWRSHMVNNCGTVRTRFAAAQLALAITLQNEKLWQKGLWDLDYILSMVNDEGFFVPTAAKGCMALGYLYSTSQLFSINVEMLAIAGFDLLEYQMRHGKSVSDAYARLFQQYEDVTISNHIAKKAIGSSICGDKPFKTHEEFVRQEFQNGENPPDIHIFNNWAIRYVVEHASENLGEQSLEELRPHAGLGGYFAVQPFEIYNANLTGDHASFDHASFWQAKQQARDSQAQKNAEILARIRKKERERVMAEMNLVLGKAGVQVSNDGLYRSHTDTGFSVRRQQFQNKSIASHSDEASKYFYQLSMRGADGQKTLYGLTVLFIKERATLIGVDIEGMVKNGDITSEQLDDVYEKCGQFDDGNPYWFEVPLTEDTYLQKHFMCVVEQSDSRPILDLVGSLITAGSDLYQNHK